MSTPTLDELVRRLIGAAFDAGIQAARNGADRNRAREDQVAYSASLLRRRVEDETLRMVSAEVARQAKEPA